MVTIIADNYYGYCKKEVKTQISYAANLYGLARRSTPAGRWRSPRYNLGDDFVAGPRAEREREPSVRRGPRAAERPRAAVHERLRDRRALSRTCSTCPEDMEIDIRRAGHHLDAPGHRTQHLKLLPGKIYIHAHRLQGADGEAPGAAPSWRLIGTVPRAPSATSRAPSPAAARPRSARAWWTRYCPDRSTSGLRRGHASWSRRSSTATTTTPGCRSCGPRRARAVAADPLARALARLRDQAADAPPAEYTDEYNAWLERIPNHIYPLVFIIKRFYQPEWGDDWREPFRRGHHQRLRRATS